MKIVLVLGLALAGMACDKTIREAATREQMTQPRIKISPEPFQLRHDRETHAHRG
jgi:hypothetical protein